MGGGGGGERGDAPVGAEYGKCSTRQSPSPPGRSKPVSSVGLADGCLRQLDRLRLVEERQACMCGVHPTPSPPPPASLRLYVLYGVGVCAAGASPPPLRGCGRLECPAWGPSPRVRCRECCSGRGRVGWPKAARGGGGQVRGPPLSVRVWVVEPAPIRWHAHPPWRAVAGGAARPPVAGKVGAPCPLARARRERASVLPPGRPSRGEAASPAGGRSAIRPLLLFFLFLPGAGIGVCDVNPAA